MEEERLLLLREHKESREKFEGLEKEKIEWDSEKSDLTERNEELTQKVSLFENELSSLREEVLTSKEQMQREQEKAALAIEKAEKAARRKPLVNSARPSNTNIGVANSAKKNLKFNKPAEVSASKESGDQSF